MIARLEVAGITVDECGFTHLAYAPEIANAMLRRQQAQAVVAARQTLVEGAVGMVEMALAQLSEKDVVELDDERRSEEHTSELQSLMRISYAVFCLKKKNKNN